MRYSVENTADFSDESAWGLDMNEIPLGEGIMENINLWFRQHSHHEEYQEDKDWDDFKKYGPAHFAITERHEVTRLSHGTSKAKKVEA